MDSTQMWLPFLQQRAADEESEKSWYWNGHCVSRGGREEPDLYNLSSVHFSMLVLGMGIKVDVCMPKRGASSNPGEPGRRCQGASLGFRPEGWRLTVWDSWRWDGDLTLRERCWGRKLECCIRGGKNSWHVVDRGTCRDRRRGQSCEKPTEEHCAPRYWQSKSFAFKTGTRSEWLAVNAAGVCQK